MTIFRTLDIILVTIMVIMAGVTYKVKYDAQKRLAEVKQIERGIEAENNMINLLNADWALMIQPSRIQKLVERYQDQLPLSPIEPQQIVRATDVPERLPDQIEELINNNSLEEGNGLLASNQSRKKVDNLKTGSIAR